MNAEGANDYSGLPGAELVRAGLADLKKGELSEAALLVLIAEPRLTALGIWVTSPRTIEGPVEHALYSLLEERWGADAFSRYNSLIRRIVSFARALEREPNRCRPLS